MQNEEFIALVKSSINENGLDNIPSDDLIVIYNRARSIEASSNIPDDELSKVINTLLEEINKRGLSPDSKQQDNHFKTIHSNQDYSFKQKEAGGSSKWVYAIAIPIIVIVIALVINKSFLSETPKAPQLDLLGYYNKHKDYYGDIPLEEVAKDAFTRGGYDKQYPDFETWKKETGIAADIEDDNDSRKPSLSDKFKEFKIPFPFRFDEESIDGSLFRFDRLTRTVEFRRSLGNNKYKWEPKPQFRNLQHVRDYMAKRDIRRMQMQQQRYTYGRERQQQNSIPRRMASPSGSGYTMCADGSYVPGNGCTMCADGSFVGGRECTMCADGSFVGGSECTMCPDGSYVPGRECTMCADGSYAPGSECTMCPDGSYVPGSECTMTPNGKYVGGN